MKKLKVCTVLTFLTLLLGVSAIPALAYKIDAGGGKWDYGVGSTYVWSYYSHKKKTHRSSVQGKYYVSSGWTPAGETSRASAVKAATGNKSYYDIK